MGHNSSSNISLFIVLLVIELDYFRDADPKELTDTHVKAACSSAGRHYQQLLHYWTSKNLHQ